MSKRVRCIIATVVSSIFIAAWIVVGGLPQSVGPTKANFDRLKDGMTLAEVQSFLGKPDEVHAGRIPPGPNWIKSATWKNQDREILVVFRWHFGTDETSLLSKQFEQEKVMDRLRRWLHLN